jgi:hypothetical protein
MTTHTRRCGHCKELEPKYNYLGGKFEAEADKVALIIQTTLDLILCNTENTSNPS